MECNHTITHELGRKALEEGLEALLVGSAVGFGVGKEEERAFVEVRRATPRIGGLFRLERLRRFVRSRGRWRRWLGWHWRNGLGIRGN